MRHLAKSRTLPCIALFILIVTSHAAVGFKNRTTPIPAYHQVAKPGVTGQELFNHHCIHCHGADGTKGFFGAKNLRKSVLPDSAIVLQIQKGKGFMPSFRKKVTPDEISQLVSYVKTLRN